MELIDRYLHSVRQYLPDAQQDDIIRELAENIRSQKEEERVTSAGRCAKTKSKQC